MKDRSRRKAFILLPRIISFEQFTDDRKYLDAFLQVLDEEGISYTAGEAEPTGLPGIQLPVPHAG